MDDCQHLFRVHVVTDLDGVKDGPVTLKLCVRCGRSEEAILKDIELAKARAKIEAVEGKTERFNKKVKEEMIKLTRGNGKVCAPIGILAWVVCRLTEERAKCAELEATIAAMRSSLEDIYAEVVGVNIHNVTPTLHSIITITQQAIPFVPSAEYVRTDNLGNKRYKISQCSCGADDWVLINGKYECNYCQAALGG
ncbi:hypothetical protein [Anaerospora hongkongensis]|uniref:hypothetical protein n=1 Tax=Anaerospora hongkongensis TaxID=244830 RepID=UPI002FD93DDD